MLMFHVAWKTKVKEDVDRTQRQEQNQKELLKKKYDFYHVVQPLVHTVVPGVDEVGFGSLHCDRAASSNFCS